MAEKFLLQGEANPENVIQGRYYRFTVLTERLIRMEYSANGTFEDQSTQVVTRRDFPAVTFLATEEKGILEISTNYFHLYYKKGPFTPQNLSIDLKFDYASYHDQWTFGDELTTLKGTARTLDKVNGATKLSEGLMAKNGYSLLDDSASFLFDENYNFKKREDNGQDFYFFAYGRDYLASLKDFFYLSGSPPLLPRFALGNWWSRYWQYSSKEYQELIRRFAVEKIPFSVAVIDMDWHLTTIPDRFGSGWTGYTWNLELFPQPKEFLSWLHQKGLKTTLNVHPAEGIRAYEEPYLRVAKRLGLNSAEEEPAPFDLTDSLFREAYFEDVHHPLEATGVDFWWIDWQQGVNSRILGLDPMWLLNHYHYLDNQKNHSEGLILSRFIGPGSQRYPIGFSGDTVISWESLDFQPYFTATATNIGYTWWSHDIGGHYHGVHDEELTLRWMQLGTFSPINRLHSSDNPFNSKEPWRFNDMIFNSMRYFLQLRHRLVPYLYTINYLTHTEGLPLVMPMYYLNSMDELAYEVPNQFYFGTELFVATITTKSDSDLKLSQVVVWFPAGKWYDFFTGVRYQGGTMLKVFRSQTDYPVFAKAGGIVPMNQDGSKNGEDLPTNLEVHIFPGSDNEFTLYEEIENACLETTFKLDWKQQQLTISLRGELEIVPKNRQITCLFRNVELDSSQKLASSIEVDVKSKTAIVEWTTFAIGTTKVIDFRGIREVQCQQIVEEVFSKLDQANISYSLKREIYQHFITFQESLPLIGMINNLTNRMLADCLFEMIYTMES